MHTRSQRAQVVKFLKDHVAGRAVIAPPVEARTDHGRLETAYEEDAVYGNLVESARGFAFDLTTLARGTRYVKMPDGTLHAEGSLNAVRVLRYELTERASTSQLLGHARFLSSTNAAPDPFLGVVFLVRMELEGAGLVVHESMTGYADFPSPGGGFRPGAVDGRYAFTLEEGRLTVRYDAQRFDVDPTTLSRTAADVKFPTQVSREITFPNPDPVAV